MRGALDDDREPAQRPHDTELTLGSGTLLFIFFGLILICGLCFGLGYTVGRRGSAEPSAAGLVPGPGAQTASSASGGRPKPSPTAPPAAASPQRAVVQLPTSTGPPPGTQANTQTLVTASAAAQPQVKPALPASAYPSQPAPALKVEPSTAPALALMVQIAAVSHTEDAEVLVNALRKRGYAVSIRRTPSDSLIHVQIGPFASRNDANAMRQKLLNDGYNAILQP